MGLFSIHSMAAASIYDMPSIAEHTWHGACLACAELARRSLITDEKLPELIGWLAKVGRVPAFALAAFEDLLPGSVFRHPQRCSFDWFECPRCHCLCPVVFGESAKRLFVSTTRRDACTDARRGCPFRPRNLNSEGGERRIPGICWPHGK